LRRDPAKHLLIAPPLLFFLLLSVVPLVLSVYFSFTNTDITLNGNWVGLTNYRRLLHDPGFTQAYKNTLLYAAIGVPVQYGLGLALALLVHAVSRGKRLIRLSFLLPFTVAPLIIGFIWLMMLDTRKGPINDLLTAVGLPAVPWLTDPHLAFVSVLIVDTWQWTPFMFLIMYAGVSTLPREPFEAARVDGATPWRMFWGVTFPMLLPASIAAVLLRAIESFKLFDAVFYLTGGGPGNQTSTVTLAAYFAGLRGGDVGYGAAMTIVLLLTVTIFGLVLPIAVRLFSRRRRDRAQVALTLRLIAERQTKTSEIVQEEVSAV
jgi:multiple sugar transport system permease protein